MRLRSIIWTENNALQKLKTCVKSQSAVLLKAVMPIEAQEPGPHEVIVESLKGARDI